MDRNRPSLKMDVFAGARRIVAGIAPVDSRTRVKNFQIVNERPGSGRGEGFSPDAASPEICYDGQQTKSSVGASDHDDSVNAPGLLTSLSRVSCVSSADVTWTVSVRLRSAVKDRSAL